ncbi:tyrosine protein phosphatase yvh1 [Agyrium rufum]|nr:tyrosine protein phosphatase yvh1 [Agyrium rufum]
MGKSRSATLVIAYLLTLPLSHPDFQDPPTPENYLTLLRQSRSIAEPNPGFMSQLQLFASMDCPTELDVHPQYQRWLYQREVELSNACGKAPDRVRFEDEVQRVQEDWEIEGGKVRQLGNKEWRCRKCRRSLLATSEYVIEHEGRTSRRSATHQQPVANGSVCSHVFLAPLSWMKEELDAGKLEGRLECPNAKCHANVGKYAWQGMKCNCGEWVVPGLALAKGKVDEMAARDDSGGHKVGGGMKM